MQKNNDSGTAANMTLTLYSALEYHNIDNVSTTVKRIETDSGESYYTNEPEWTETDGEPTSYNPDTLFFFIYVSGDSDLTPADTGYATIEANIGESNYAKYDVELVYDGMIHKAGPFVAYETGSQLPGFVEYSDSEITYIEVNPGSDIEYSYLGSSKNFLSSVGAVAKIIDLGWLGKIEVPDYRFHLTCGFRGGNYSAWCDTQIPAYADAHKEKCSS